MPVQSTSHRRLAGLGPCVCLALLTLVTVGLFVGCAKDDRGHGLDEAGFDPGGDGTGDGQSAGEGDAGETEGDGDTGGDGEGDGGGSDETGDGGGSESEDGTGADDTSESPPETCLTGKVGVFDVNTGFLYPGDSDFVVHTYPSNDPDDAPASTADFFAKVEADPSVDKNFLFASGFSYGATMSLIHGYMSSDRLAGIIHISQYSDPDHFRDEVNGATRRIPVYIIHDDSYCGGGQQLRQFLLDAGYQDGVDLFYLDFVGGHDVPPPEEWETVLEWIKTMSLNGPCEDGG